MCFKKSNLKNSIKISSRVIFETTTLWLRKSFCDLRNNTVKLWSDNQDAFVRSILKKKPKNTLPMCVVMGFSKQKEEIWHMAGSFQKFEMKQYFEKLHNCSHEFANAKGLNITGKNQFCRSKILMDLYFNCLWNISVTINHNWFDFHTPNKSHAKSYFHPNLRK